MASNPPATSYQGSPFGILMKCSIFYSFQENEMTWAGRTKRSDASVMQDFYYHYYRKNIHALPAAVDKYGMLLL